MPSNEYYTTLADRMKSKSQRKKERLVRDIEDGIIPGKIIKVNLSGIEKIIIKLYGKKGYVPYSTRKLEDIVKERFDSNEKTGLGRICYINSNRGGLQIRGKHLKRLLKKMPNLKHKGNLLYEE